MPVHISHTRRGQTSWQWLSATRLRSHGLLMNQQTSLTLPEQMFKCLTDISVWKVSSLKDLFKNRDICNILTIKECFKTYCIVCQLWNQIVQAVHLTTRREKPNKHCRLWCNSTVELSRIGTALLSTEFATSSQWQLMDLRIQYTPLMRLNLTVAAESCQRWWCVLGIKSCTHGGDCSGTTHTAATADE